MSKRWKSGRYEMGKLRRQGMKILFILLFFTFSVKAMAEEANLEESPAPAAGDHTEAQLETNDKKLISVEFPIPEEGENSPFDFVLDPYRLLFRTGAGKYGGGSVEEGATLLFRNRDGEYTFSRYSDYLTVVNQGEQPVAVTVSATVSGLEGMELASTDDFSEWEEQVIYLALTDETGRTQPLSTEEEVSFNRVVEPGSWSLRLTGACNPDADWQRMTSVCPRISIRWYVESVEEPEADTKQDNPEEEIEEKKETPDSAELPEDADSAEESKDSDGAENPEDSAPAEEPSEESAGDDNENQDADSSVSGNDSLLSY